MSLGRLALSQLRYQARWSLALGFCLVAALGLTSILAGMEQVAEHDGLRQALASSSVTVERTGLPDTAAFDSFQLQAARAVTADQSRGDIGGPTFRRP